MIVIFLVSLACAGCDQGTKSFASNHLPKNEMISYFHDTVRIGYTENAGAFLSFGELWPENIRFLIFTVMTGLFLLGLFLYLVCNSKLDFLSIAGLSLILGGGSSNLYDRLINDGIVIDFLNVGVGGVRTGIFNVADMAIMFGGVLVFLAHSRKKSRASGF